VLAFCCAGEVIETKSLCTWLAKSSTNPRQPSIGIPLGQGIRVTAARLNTRSANPATRLPDNTVPSSCATGFRVAVAGRRDDIAIIEETPA
jgi:hypothetical protein